MSARVPAPLKRVTEELCEALAPLKFRAPVHTVLNPLIHAGPAHRKYLARYGRGKKQTLFLGMNPGPWGMNQTGVPFGEVAAVRDWMGIEAKVIRPHNEHPARPILGFDCTRSEVSGARLWGWAAERYGDAESFFEHRFVINYCPLIFLEESGRNLTPDKLDGATRKKIEAICDDALSGFVEYFQPERILGVGKFAEKAARRVFKDSVEIASIPHPSPASPLANRGWSALVEQTLEELGYADL